MMTGNGNSDDAMSVMPDHDSCQVGNPEAVDYVMIQGNVAVSNEDEIKSEVNSDERNDSADNIVMPYISGKL